MGNIDISYYEAQLKKIKLNTEFSPMIQITDGKGNKTHHMNITKESAETIIVWLKNNFILKK